jgi:glycosyltransferase involved in cell wall biosynthesis/pyruvate-formate lyase-activating enzyme
MVLPISVIIPVRNMESTIEECLISVQRNNPAEIIVVDGNSSDRTVEIARKYTEKIYSDEGRGTSYAREARAISYARQLGAEQATQEYIAYVDADMVLPEETLSTMLAELKAGGYANIQAKVLAASLNTYWERATDWYCRFMYSRKGQGGTSAAVLRRDTVLNIRFDPFIFSGDDYDFLKRLKVRGYKLGCSSASVYHHHRAHFKSLAKWWFHIGWGYPYLMKKWGPWRKGLWTPLVSVYFVALCLIKGKPNFIPYFVVVVGIAGTAGMVKGFAQIIGEALASRNKVAIEGPWLWKFLLWVFSMNKLRCYLAELPLTTRKRMIEVFLSVINFPIVNNIYHRIYYALIKRKASYGLSKMDLETYNVCNLRCVMCPYRDMTREKVLMSMELFKKIIDDAAKSGIREIGLNFYNEPLLDPLLFERIEYAKMKGLKVCFSSNGTILTKEKRDALLDSGIDSITFSFDGATKEVYERVRVGANFEKTRDNIIGLVKERNRRGLKKPSISMAFVAQKDNYQEVKQFRSFWQEFVDKIGISTEVIDRKAEGLLPDKLKPRVKQRRPYPCRRIFEVMAVMSNGKVALCCVDYDGSIILGDLNKQTILEVRDSNKCRKMRQLHLNGQGDKIKLCQNIACPSIYGDGAFKWWGSFDYT